MLIESTGAIQQASQATGTSFNYLLVEFESQPACRASTSWARGLFKFAAIRPPIRPWPEPSPRPTLGVKRAARPSTQRGRTLYCALSRCRRCRTVDHAGLGPSQRQSRGFFRERRPGQFPDLLRPGHWRRPQRRAGAQCPHCPLRRRALQSGSPNVDGAGGDGADARVLPLWIPQALPTPSLPRLPRSSRATQRCFTDCFADANRTAPLARVVNALWRVPNAEPGTGATARRTPVANGVLDLFKDTPVKGS